MKRNEKIVIRPEAQLPIEALKESIFDLGLADRGRCQAVEENTVPTSWKAAAESLLDMGKPKVLVAGQVDMGKSSLCTYIVNTLLAKHLEVAIIDGDIGQADVGPPTTIGLATASAPIISLSSSDRRAIFFVGSTSPGPVTDKVIQGMKKILSHEAVKGKPIIINTDGWVDDAAIAYKSKLIAELNPDAVFALVKKTEMEPILESVKILTYKLIPSRFVKERSREDRMRFREFGYRKHLVRAENVRLTVEGISVRHFDGRQIPDIGELRKYKGAILGLLDAEGWLKSIAVLKGVERERTIRVFTPNAVDVAAVEVGALKISPDGSELGYFEGVNP